MGPESFTANASKKCSKNCVFHFFFFFTLVVKDFFSMFTFYFFISHTYIPLTNEDQKPLLSFSTCNMYRAPGKCLYVVARNFFLLLLNCSAWPCLGPVCKKYILFPDAICLFSQRPTKLATSLIFRNNGEQDPG